MSSAYSSISPRASERMMVVTETLMAGLSARCPHCGALGLEGAAFCVECGGRMPLGDSKPNASGEGARSSASSTTLTAAQPPSLLRTTLVHAVPPPPPQRTSEHKAPEVSHAPQPPPPPLRSSEHKAEHSGPPPAPSRRPLAPRRPSVPSPRSAPKQPGEVPNSLIEALTDAAATETPVALSYPPPAPTPPAPAVGAVPTPSSAVDASPAEPAQKSGVSNAGPEKVTSESPTMPRAADPPESPDAGSRRVLDEIDRRFEAIVSQPPEAGPGRDLNDDEFIEARRLFLEISNAHLGPVRDLIVEIELGEPTKEWLSVCRPAVAALRRAANDMALAELAAGLSGLLSVIEQGERTLGNLLDARTREGLKAAYQKLSEHLPQAFEVKEARNRREPLILSALLQQVPDVRRVALDRMYAAGLISLDQFYKAKPGEIAEAAGISRELAERIVARFQRYKRELGTLPPTPRRQREKVQLETLVKKLEDQNAAYETSGKSWIKGDDKRRIRQERASTLLEVSLLLARLGEVDLIASLEPLPFHKKAEALRRYLSQKNERTE